MLSSKSPPRIPVSSFPVGPTGRYGVSGRSEGGRSSCVTPATTNYCNRTAKAKPPKQQGAGDAEEEEEEEEEWYLQRPSP